MKAAVVVVDCGNTSNSQNQWVSLDLSAYCPRAWPPYAGAPTRADRLYSSRRHHRCADGGRARGIASEGGVCPPRFASFERAILGRMRHWQPYPLASPGKQHCLVKRSDVLRHKDINDALGRLLYRHAHNVISEGGQGMGVAVRHVGSNLPTASETVMA